MLHCEEDLKISLELDQNSFNLLRIIVKWVKRLK